MEIGPVGSNQLNLDSAIQLLRAIDPVKAFAVPLAAPAEGDCVGILLQQLATPQIVDLIAVIEKGRAVRDPAGIVDLIRTAVKAIDSGDTASALGTIKNLVVVYPEELESLKTEPLLSPIRDDVERLLQQHATASRTNSEDKLSLASQAFETAGERDVRTNQVDVPQVLSVAHQLIDSGRHAHVVLAGELSQVVINYYAPIQVTPANTILPEVEKLASTERAARRAKLAIQASALDSLYHDTLRSMGAAWDRLPASLLIIVWLVVGLLSGFATMLLRSLGVELLGAALPLEIWGAGSVGLIGFGTYRRSLR